MQDGIVPWRWVRSNNTTCIHWVVKTGLCFFIKPFMDTLVLFLSLDHENDVKNS